MGRIFLLVDHQSLAEAIATIIVEQSQGALRVIGHAQVTLAGVTELETARPDAVLLAIGFNAIKELYVAAVVRMMAPRAAILVVDLLGEAARAIKAYPQPVDAILTPEQLPNKLIPTLLELLA